MSVTIAHAQRCLSEVFPEKSVDINSFLKNQNQGVPVEELIQSYVATELSPDDGAFSDEKFALLLQRLYDIDADVAAAEMEIPSVSSEGTVPRSEYDSRLPFIQSFIQLFKKKPTEDSSDAPPSSSQDNDCGNFVLSSMAMSSEGTAGVRAFGRSASDMSIVSRGDVEAPSPASTSSTTESSTKND